MTTDGLAAFDLDGDLESVVGPQRVGRKVAEEKEEAMNDEVFVPSGKVESGWGPSWALTDFERVALVQREEWPYKPRQEIVAEGKAGASVGGDDG